MTPVFLILAFCFLQGIRGDDLTAHPVSKQFCDVDPFVSSRPFDGKVFLIPAKVSERKSDWYASRAYCAANCAEMVTLHSKEESDFFTNFSAFAGVHTWIGAQAIAGNFSWSHEGEIVNFINPAANEFNNPGQNCIHVHAPNLYWYSYLCNEVALITIACQRPADWKPCE